jgi:hypothetical protein
LIEGIQVKDLKDSITSKQEDIYEIAGAAGYVGEDGTYKGAAFNNYLNWAEQHGTAEK